MAIHLPPLGVLLLALAPQAGGNPPAGAPAPVPRVESRAGEGTARVVEIRRSQQAMLQLLPGEPPKFRVGDHQSGLSLSIDLSGPDFWRERVKGSAEFEAEDDLGNLYRLGGGFLSPFGRFGGSGYRHSLYVGSLDPRARSLRRLEGTIPVYSARRTVRHSFSLPAERESAAFDGDGVRATLKTLPSDLPVLQFVLEYETGEAGNVMLRETWGRRGIRLLDARGNEMEPRGWGSGGSGGNGKMTLTYRIDGLSERPARIDMEWLVLSGPVRQESVRFAHLPLPAAEEPEANRPPHPLLDPAAKTLLTCRITRSGRPAGTGVLLWGLLPAGGVEPAGPIRWLESRTDAKGVARLERVRPGRYRVRLRWRAAAAPGQPPRIVERGATAVEITAAGEVTLPPFEVAPQPVAAPRTPPKPAVKNRRPRPRR